MDPYPRRRVVITGVGLVSPLGVGTEITWRRLLAGESGVGPITRFDASELPTRIAGEVPDFDPALYLDKKDLKKTDRFIQLAVAASQEALEDSGLVIGRSLRGSTMIVTDVGSEYPLPSNAL